MTSACVWFRGLCLFKFVLVRATDRADPVVGQILESGAGLNTIGGITGFGVIFISADKTSVFFHD